MKKFLLLLFLLLPVQTLAQNQSVNPNSTVPSCLPLGVTPKLAICGIGTVANLPSCPAGYDCIGKVTDATVCTSSSAPLGGGTLPCDVINKHTGGGWIVASGTGVSPPPTCPVTFPVLSNPQNPVNAPYNADATGVADVTTAFQSAVNAGDLDIPAGTFKLAQVSPTTITVPSGHNVRCENGAVLNTNTSTSVNFHIFEFNDTASSSIVNCKFRGPNYNIASIPPLSNSFQSAVYIQTTSALSKSHDNLVACNDFNGIAGFIGAVQIYGNDGNQPASFHNTVQSNTAEHCGYYFIQISSGKNNIVTGNTLNDCAGFVEADDIGQQNTGNLVDSNHLTFTYGVGQSASNGGSGCNILTCGLAPANFNYSGNTCSNNIVDGTHASSVNRLVNAGGTPAVYTSNTCTGSCVLDQCNG
jgi:hypothetical protein